VSTQRRPGVQKLADEIWKSNPRISRREALAQAKAQWTEKHQVKEGADGKMFFEGKKQQ
jgi:hypothetical protein